MFLGTSLGAVASVVFLTCTAAVGSPYIGVDVGGVSVTGGDIVLRLSTGNATLGVMGISGTASVVGHFLDLSLFTTLFVVLGAEAGNPGTLRGTRACMTGGGVADCTNDVIPDDGLSGSGLIWELTTPAFLTWL